MKTRFRRLSRDLLLAVQERLLREHGGMAGVRDAGLLESALARPVNRAGYKDVDVFELAAAYAYGIIRNHPFIDGNKRVGFIAAYVFLEDNGQEFTASEEQAAMATLALAEGSLSEQQYAHFLRDHCTAVK